jgi:hypothetical protein
MCVSLSEQGYCSNDYYGSICQIKNVGPENIKISNMCKTYHNCWSGKAISITYFCVCVCVCVYACVRGARARIQSNLPSVQRACAVLYCHLWPLWLHQLFPHYFINGTILIKKVTERKTCLLIFSTTFTWNISHSRKNSARYCHKSKKSSCKAPVILVRF